MTPAFCKASMFCGLWRRRFPGHRADEPLPNAGAGFRERGGGYSVQNVGIGCFGDLNWDPMLWYIGDRLYS